jgi:hypothetical protein
MELVRQGGANGVCWGRCMDVYSIKNWAKHYEKAQTRKVENAQWVPVPVKHDGKGFRRLMAMPNGASIYGAWMLILQVAAKCKVRGTLADEDGPLTAEDLALKTGCPESLFSEALEVLSGSAVGWMLVSRTQRDTTPVDSDPKSLQLQDRTEQDITGQNKEEDAPADAGCPSGLRPWLEWWNGLRAESLVPCGVDVEAPSQAIVKAWGRVEKSAQLRKMLADRAAIESQIRGSPFVWSSGWFRLERLFGGNNKDGELILRKLLDGGYRQEKPTANTIGAGQKYNPQGELKWR